MGKGVKRAERRRAESARALLPIAELEFTLRRGLREFVVETGMKALGELLEEERTELCGPRYKHEPGRIAHRAGFTTGELAMGGRRVQVRRPRARAAERELELPTWRQFSSEDPLHERALEEMVIGVSTRKYRRALEELPPEVKERGTSKSAVSRRFIAATQKALATWLGRDLTAIELAAVMIDGLMFGDERVVLIALGIDSLGKKHVLGIHEGATENAATCGALLDDIIARGVATERSRLFVVDGSKALVKAIRDRFGERALIQRCQVHKKRNVRDHLPEYMRSTVSTTLTQAYQTRDVVRATRLLENLARSLEDDHPSAAASVREGLAETLTVVRLGLPQQLCRVLATTNAIENLNSTARDVCHRVKRWRSGEMILRWTCAAMLEAEKKFRRVQGFKVGMPMLSEAPQRNDERIDGKLDEAIAAANRVL
jgi:transposase-like protein